MKRIIQGIPPLLLLIFALTFMIEYKQLNHLTDIEKYEIRTFVEAAESDDNHERRLDNNIASSHVEVLGDMEEPVDPNMTYAITSDDEIVNVHDDEGKVVFQATMDDWEENREYYYEKYRLGSF